jgi:hypothetical protein
MDEVYKGTTADVGERRLEKLGIAVAPLRQSMCIIASHHKRAALLEDTTKGEFTNYHAELIEQPDHSFVRTFKLKKGRNEWWESDDEKRDRYIDWITSID